MNGKIRRMKRMEIKVEGEAHTSCMDEMTCATPLSKRCNE